tara:strand:- start:1625 stop:2110 length:486 start_codon:yes stop_codon:yes gene_type:complete
MDLFFISFTQEIIFSMIFWTIFGCAIIAEVANNKRIDQISSLLLLMFIIYPSFFQPIIREIAYSYNTNLLFSHSWLPFIYQYSIGILIFGGGLFTIFKAYGQEEFWAQYKTWIAVLVWGFIYVSSIHLLMTIAALNNTPQLYLVIIFMYCSTALILSRYVR